MSKILHLDNKLEQDEMEGVEEEEWVCFESHISGVAKLFARGPNSNNKEYRGPQKKLLLILSPKQVILRSFLIKLCPKSASTVR